MPVQPQFRDYILEQLAGLPGVHANRMFGGIGLYSDGLFFGLIDDDTVFFKTDASNVERYRARNMPRFMPFPDRPEAVLGYHQVPADVLEDAEALVAWARLSVAVAEAARTAKRANVRKKAKPGKKTPLRLKAKPGPKTKAKRSPPRMARGRSRRRQAT